MRIDSSRRAPARMLRTLSWWLAACTLASAATAAEDVFEFIPQGGRTLAASVLENTAASSGEATDLLGATRSRDEWLAWLRGHEKQLAGVHQLDDRQLLTLADYLSFNMPQSALKAPASASRAGWEKALPPDGRDLALNYCQGCHIITVVVTQNRTKEAWLGTMGKPSHVQIKLSPRQREALASYLVINAAIPIDDVPEELRAGGATY